MNKFKNLIEKNKDIDFVIHIQTKEELDELIEILDELGYEYAIPLGSLREMADQFVTYDGYDGCWRVSESKGIAYNPSVEHWKFFTNDIVEIQNGEIQFHDGYSTMEASRIESEKLWKAFTDENDAAINLSLFGLQDASQEEIIFWLEDRFGKINNTSR